METFTMSGAQVRLSIKGPGTQAARRRVLSDLRSKLRDVRRKDGPCAVPAAFDAVAQEVAQSNFCTFTGSIDDARFRSLLEAFA